MLPLRIAALLLLVTPVLAARTDAARRMDELFAAYQSAGRDAASLRAIEEFWGEQDDAHAKDAAYLLTKSRILGWLDRDDDAAAIFDRVADVDLQEPYQMFNRLQRRIDDDLVSSHALLLHLLEVSPSVFADWLQETYAQRFTPTLSAVRATDEHIAFVRSLADPTHPRLAAASVGLRAWVDAQLVGDDVSRLRDIAARNLSGENAREPRYTLLLARRISAHEELRGRAREMIDDLIVRLRADQRLNAEDGAERAVLKERARLRYLLAHACAMRARLFHLDRGDLAGAETWMEQAAHSAPTRADHDFTAAFAYEIDLLDGQTEYASAYAEYLESAGRNDDALEQWIRLAIVDVEQIDALAAAQARLRPHEDFRKFWSENIESRLPAATDFELPSFDGEPHRLSDYRDRWVLIDFWGTWCGPCRKELPALEAFYRRVSHEAPATVAVLTVACNDQPNAVKKFMADQGYTFPVVMGDDAVTTSFAITGYPTKVIVTPSGRWLKLYFGANWNHIAERLLLAN